MSRLSKVHWEYIAFPFPRLVCTNCDVGWIHLDQTANRCPFCGAWMGGEYFKPEKPKPKKPWNAYTAVMKGW